jgi:RimJ/RimL family protein N-acetyltransferase
MEQNIDLRCPNKDDLEVVRQWRNQELGALRTSHMLTEEMQQQFYHDVVCDRRANARYWSFGWPSLVAFGGLEHIEWENRRAEISLIVNPHARGKNIGSRVVAMILSRGFRCLNLDNIYGEVYQCNDVGMAFWLRICEWYSGQRVSLHNTKFWYGAYYDSMWFNINRASFVAKVVQGENASTV